MKQGLKLVLNEIDERSLNKYKESSINLLSNDQVHSKAGLVHKSSPEDDTTCYYSNVFNIYSGYCAVRRRAYYIKYDDLFETANYHGVSNYAALHIKLINNEYFNVAYTGDTLIPISSYLRNVIISHFWESYKVLL